MSSEIFYKKAFIKVEDKYIPLTNHGSSNCFDINYQGREVADKHWNVLCYPYSDRFIFTENEVREIAKCHEEANTSNRGGTKKSRYTAFEVGEFERWILAGMKSAYTVEEYTKFGNRVQIKDYETGRRTTVDTTQELIAGIEAAKGHSIDIGFANERDVRRPQRSFTPKIQNEFDAMECYYVLRTSDGYFMKLSRRGVWNLVQFNKDRVRKFKSEKEALAYLKKNERRMRCFQYQVECIRKESAA